MPELPEVETTLRGIEPHLLDQTITDIIIRDHRLRWPVPESLKTEAIDQEIKSVKRRGKYILIRTDTGTIILHLGMSGNLRILPANSPPKKHDHIDLILSNKQCLRFHDPRRFGCCLWTRDDPLEHKLLKNLGPEPWDDEFNALMLHKRSRQRKIAIKNFIMDSKVVVGVGNIYASEALFLSKINPNIAAGKISLKRFEVLITAIQKILDQAIKQGGTTLRDFTNSSGEPGYFKQELAVYGREGEPCVKCKKPIRKKVIGQRSSFYCRNCQPGS